MIDQKKIIGISGAFGSGKSTAADLLQELGYHKISLSSFLEEELERRGALITRENLQDLGNEWRVKFGNSILVQRAIDKAERNNWTEIVIEGFRNSEEILYLRKYRALFISLVVNRATRLTRLKNLKRREELTEEIFERLDNRDLGIGEKESGLQTALCLAMADIFIENNGSLKELEDRVKEIKNKYE